MISVSQSELLCCVTRPKGHLWPRLCRWRHRSVTFCETYWPRGLSSWWDADNCQSWGTWGTSPFSSSCRLAAALFQNSPLWAVLSSSECSSWCCSQCWPVRKKIRTQWKTVADMAYQLHKVFDFTEGKATCKLQNYTWHQTRSPFQTVKVLFGACSLEKWFKRILAESPWTSSQILLSVFCEWVVCLNVLFRINVWEAVHRR